MKNLTKEQILNMIKENKISAKEGVVLFKNAEKSRENKRMDIAVIGISGIFPQANNVEEFWDNLKEGKNSVRDITRWNPDDYYDPIPGTHNKSYCKSGGFLDRIDQFDPLFFELSPKQAEMMEPRQRLFLQEAFRAIEDAGYTEKQVKEKKIGVFLGCEGSTEYFKDIKEEEVCAHVFLGHSNAILASRISYFMNLQGPSLTIDTACSSSLVAIHTACESIISGNCEMALAGGVNIMTEPEMYILLCSMGMLSPEGKCKAFDNQADGFVPGEAIGAVLLKPLEAAVRDRDHIYGVIKGSGINQDGKTNGITAPSTLSQARLETQVYKEYGINPEDISYVETHGTGTKLGDPIEIEALKRSFANFTDQRAFCALGSVKTNIGHASAASGVTSFIKVLLAMKYKKIPPLLHFRELNEQIILKDSPFYINTSLCDWEPEGGKKRMAAISSFGHSGTNCHMVIEEWNKFEENTIKLPYYFIPFSGKSKESVKNYIKVFLKWLEKQGQNYDLGSIAYNLLACRNHFRERIALVAEDKGDLINQLKSLIANDFEECFEKKQSMQTLLNEKEKILERINDKKFPESPDYLLYLLKVKDLYEASEYDDASILYGNDVRAHISLPTYQFLEEHYWLEKSSQKAKTIGKEKLSALIDSNESTLQGLFYKKTFHGNEFFIRDHMNMLPAVVYLEMVRTAAGLANQNYKIKNIKNSVWHNPILFEGKEKEVYVNLYKKNEFLNYSILTADEHGNKEVHSQGKIEYFKDVSPQNELISYDVEDILKRCTGGVEEADKFYRRLESMGAVLGSRFQGMQEFYFNDQEAISVLGIPKELEKNKGDYILHPTLTDGGLQTVVTWAYHTSADLNTIYLPFVLGCLEFENKNIYPKYAYVRKSQKQNKNGDETIKYDIDYLDETGCVVYRMKEFCIRALKKLRGRDVRPEKITVGYWRMVWNASDRKQSKIQNMRPLVLFSDKRKNAKEFEGRNKQIISIIRGSEFKKVNSRSYMIDPEREEDYNKLFLEISLQYQSGFDVLHMWNSGEFDCNYETMQSQIGQSLYSGYHIIRALQKRQSENEVRVSFLYESEGINNHPLYQALGGFCRSIRMENEAIISKTICIDPELKDKEELLVNEFDSSFDADIEVYYQKEGRRLVKCLEEDRLEYAHTDLPFRESATYLITGGAGGLGLFFADYLCRKYCARVILVGRSALNEERTEKLRQLQENQGEVIYLRCDITKPEQVKKVISKAKKKYGEINGVIHSAGVVRDAMIAKKDFLDFKNVIEPKVFGTINLYEALKDESLDCFVMFSSTTAVLGNAGQTDYAYANSFMDQFAWLQKDREDGCKFCSINWPMWKDGGMHIDSGMQDYIEKTFGMKAISRELGEKIFEEVLSKNTCQQIVFAGDMEKIRSKVLNERKLFEKQTKKDRINDDHIAQMFSVDFMYIMSELLKMKEEDIDIKQNMEVYGFDSITFTELANRLNDRFGIDVIPASFFGHASPKSIIDMLLEDFGADIKAHYNNTVTERIQTEAFDDIATYVEDAGETVSDQYIFGEEEENGTNEDENENAVAIIGMHGIMPQSEDLDEFWNNLLEGKNMISEIPKDRWDWKDYYGDPQKENKTNVKWGGFMKHIDRFDPMFFHISGRDAEAMDPQERMVIESVWKTVEDAGYRISDLHQANTGVFIGVTNADYAELMIQNQKTIAMTHTMITNRVSYLFDFTGPSETIDTACSSSLVAIHRAVEEINNHSCDYAIAGGINVIACPNLYIFQSKAGMLSPDGVCRTFDKDANGYVRGEGVGTILLKSLKKAKRDGDHIYGIVLGTGMNHNGHGNDLLAPSSNAQANVIAEAIERASIDPETISYIETHGTGTKLGDPVEIEGLKKAFRKLYTMNGKTSFTEKKIGIGTVKTNIGHLESAAGIAGVIKVLLSMKNKKFPGLLHFHELNPYIQLEDSPFYIVDKNCEWKRKLDHEKNEIPRRAGISSFGIGGVNVHVVLQEYIAEPVKENTEDAGELILLSAKNSDNLKTYAKKMYDYLSKSRGDEAETIIDFDSEGEIEQRLRQIVAQILHVDEQDICIKDNVFEYDLQPLQIAELCERLEQVFGLQVHMGDVMKDVSLENMAKTIALFVNNKKNFANMKGISSTHDDEKLSLRNLAYTLQVGREEMDERLVFIASSIREVCDKLNAYITDKISEETIIYAGSVERQNNLSGESEKEEMIHRLLSERDLDKLGRLWAGGEIIDWKILHQEFHPKRISLPTYPFAEERYWLMEELEKRGVVVVKETDDDAVMAMLKRIASGELKAEDAKFI